ncbi:sporulation protein YunB [Microbacteriaceae bacterium 4G12]
MRRLRPYRFRRGPLPFRYVLVISFCIFLFLTIQGLWIVNRSIEPTLMTYAHMQTKRLATVIITKAINDQIKDGFNTEKLITVQSDNQGRVSTIDFNPEIVNRILTSTTTYAEKYLHMAEQGEIEKLGLENDPKLNVSKNTRKEGILFSVPLGQLTKNALLGNLGPHIPVSFRTIGDVSPNIKHNVKPYGINNALVEVIIEVEVTLQVIIPFQTDKTVVKIDVPVAMRVIQGEVPSYYGGGKEGASPALPAPKQTEKR